MRFKSKACGIASVKALALRQGAGPDHALPDVAPQGPGVLPLLGGEEGHMGGLCAAVVGDDHIFVRLGGEIDVGALPRSCVVHKDGHVGAGDQGVLSAGQVIGAGLGDIQVEHAVDDGDDLGPGDDVLGHQSAVGTAPDVAQTEHGVHRLGELIGHLGVVAGGLARVAHPVTAEIGPAEAAGDHIDGLLPGEGLVGLDVQVGVQGHTIVVHSGDGVIVPGRFSQVGVRVAIHRLHPQNAVENGGELAPGDRVIRVEFPVWIALEDAGIGPSVDIGLGPVLIRYIGVLRRKCRRLHAAGEQQRQEQRL